jgi:hypothetical protein
MGISLVAEQLLASQEGLNSVELVNFQVENSPSRI